MKASLALALSVVLFFSLGSSVFAAGASCTTPWGSKVVADGASVSYEPYFTNGAYLGAVVVPVMKCSNGTWLQCDYTGANCVVYGTGTPVPSAPGSVPAPTRTSIPKQEFPNANSPTLTSPIQVACSFIYAPVCGSDGKTYGNSCSASNAGVTTAHNGECTSDTPAPATYTPPVYTPPVSITATNAINRSLGFLSAAVDRASGLMARIDSRIAKLPSVTTQIQIDAAAAHKEINAAIAALQSSNATRVTITSINTHLHAALIAIQTVLNDIRYASN